MRQLIESGDLRHDIAQEQTARRFSKLQAALKNYDNDQLVDYHMQRKELDSRRKEIDESNDTLGNDKDVDKSTKFHLALPLDVKIPRGLYVFGDVGTGKSMLMDMFFARVSIPKKRRVHFHAFMQEVHQRIHALKKLDLEEKGRDFHVDVSEDNNPIIRVAEQFASEVSLLCFDEFQVTDVADALILKQLFTTLFKYGTVVVATSNRPPSALYEGGINRSYFLPFIGLLEHHCIIHQLQSTLDYRKFLSREMDNFFFVGPENNKLDEVFQRLLDGKAATSMRLAVSFQRQIVVQRAHPDCLVCRFSFAELCQRDVGAADYRAVAQTFPVVILERIPQLNLTQHNEARRFITLIDELYEQKCALMCSAEYPPEELFLNRHQDPAPPSAIEIKVGEAFGIDVAQSSGKPVGSLASVRELSFAFQRASSRLSEMCSAKCWDQALTR
jgi:protein AFG1